MHQGYYTYDRRAVTWNRDDDCRRKKCILGFNNMENPWEGRSVITLYHLQAQR